MQKNNIRQQPNPIDFRRYRRLACSSGRGSLLLGLLVLWSIVSAGCGTTRFTNTARSATEQLLISDAIDRAVDQIDVSPLAGYSVYIDTKPLARMTDATYLSSTLRQKLLANGCILKEKASDATLVVEARAGAIGTDNNNLVYGIPAVNVPTGLLAASGGMAPVPSIPEVPFIKKTKQRGVVKLALFAYDSKTSRAFWQSGASPVLSKTTDLWIFGAGPFQWGSIYDEAQFAGTDIPVPLYRDSSDPGTGGKLSVTEPVVFHDPDAPALLEVHEREKILQASHTEKVTPKKAAIGVRH